jgi:uncharacterized protein (TIGR03067 family)
MLRSVVFALAAGLMLAPLALADEPKDKPAEHQENGTWVPVDGMSAGKKLPDNFLTSVKLLLRDGKYTTIVGEDKEEGTYKVDTSKSPHPIDIEASMGPNKGKKIPAIVEMKGDTMRVCYNPEGTERPKDFVSTADNKFLLISYKRAKDGQQP